MADIIRNDCQSEDIEPRGDLLIRAEGRNRFLRDRGEIKTPELIDELIAEISRLKADLEEAKAAASAVWNEAVEACISDIRNQIAVFSSEEYATGQPHSSFGERFACNSCINALRSLKRTDKENGDG